MGMGHWVRGQHEHLLIASKGAPPLPPTESVPASVFRERRREHSRKPEASYRIIEALYPALPKIELFARQVRPGWMQWGNEAAEQVKLSFTMATAQHRASHEQPSYWA